ncbi:putative leucine-rich repeat-containing protein DDB_G0290503 isoform X2 [Anthonomus grandis grandis]|uniref:putative leucine-rich repeat-containing protein DDB_G0290503 isoform X2 n=1 Tax=Anthonomus grandis grandis TaxID=2921223 RepID=UPI002166487F|nr:putative leucine-rich repeat-containing protein DDB_G0290503 isoform X2 [Anthonomus grandis grandis]
MDNMFDDVEPEQIEVEDVFRTIFSACDPENTNLVRVSRLIEFIKPFLSEDLNPLEDLRSTLDPDGTDILVNASTFYEIIGQWSQKLSSTSPQKDDDFNQSRNLSTEPKDLSYLHSTPRTSLGDKLLKYFKLLEPETTQLEEEKKELEHQLAKISKELLVTKHMLKLAEEQSDKLQDDLNRVNRRLLEEQQVIEHLQKNTNNDEDLKDEINRYKNYIAELKKKVTDLEQDNAEFRKLVEDVEKEKLKVEKKLNSLSTEHEACLTALSDVTLAMDNMRKMIDEKLQEKESKLERFERCFKELQDLVEMLEEKNLALISELAKCKSDKSTSCAHSNLGKYFDPPSPSTSQHSSPQKMSARPKCESLHLLKRALNRFSSTPQGEHSILNTSLPSYLKTPVCSPLDPGSSEEDLMSKFHNSGNTSNSEKNGQQSLWAEMSKVDPRRYSAILNDTELFEKNEQITELEYKVETLEKELDELKSKNGEWEKLAADLTGNNEALCGEIDDLKVAIQEKNAELECLRNELEDARKLTKIGVEADLEPTITDNKKHLAAVTTFLQAEKTSADEKLHSLINHLGISENFQEVQELKGIIDKLLHQNRELHEENFTAKKKAEIMTAKCQNLMQKIAVLQDENSWVAEVEKERNKSMEAREKYEKELIEYKETIEKKMVADFENRTKHSLDSEKKIHKLTQSLHEKTLKLKDAETRIEDLSNQNKLIQQEIDECRELKDILEIKLIELQTQNQEERIKISNMGGLCTDITSFVKDKNRVIEELKNLNTTLERKLNEAHADLKRKIETLWEMQRDLAKGDEVKNELWTKMKSLENVINVKISEINRLEINSEFQKVEYSNLLIIHDLELNKNASLENNLKKCQNELLQVNEILSESEAKAQRLSEQSAALQTLVIEYETAVSQIKKTYSDYKESQQKKLEEKCEEIQALQARLKEYTDAERADVDAQTILDDIPDLDQLLNELKAKLNNEMDKNKQLTEDLLQLQSNYSENVQELERMRQKLEDNELDMSQRLQENHNLLNHQLRETKEYAKNKNKELNLVNIELLETKEMLAKQDLLIQNQQNKLRRKDEEMAKIEKELGRLHSEILDLEGSNKKLTAENVRLSQNLQNIETTLTDEFNKRLKDLTSELNKKKTEVEELQSENTTVREELLKIQEDNQNLRVQAEAVKQLQKDKKELLAIKDDLDQVMANLIEELNGKKKEIEEVQTRNSTVREELEKVQEENRNLVAQASLSAYAHKNLQKELLATKESKDDLNAVIVNLTVELNDKKVEIEDLQSKNLSVGQQLVKMQVENNDLIEQVSLSSHELTNQKELTKELQEDKENLLRELSTVKQAKEDVNQELITLRETNSSIIVRLQEEETKTKHQFEQYLTLKRENDNLRFELKECEALLQNSQIISHKKQQELAEYKVKCVEMEAKLNCQKEKLDDLEANYDLCVKQVKTVTAERNKLSNDLEKVTGKTKTYSKQQVMIERLKVQIEELELKLRQKTLSSEELTAKLTAHEELSTLNEHILEKRMECEMLELQVTSSKSHVEALEDRLSILEAEVQNANRRLQEKRGSCVEVGTQTMKQTRESKPINKFTLSNQSEDLDLPCFGADSLAHLRFPCAPISAHSTHTESCVEVPSIDVKGFADIIEELDLAELSSSQSLKDLEEKVTALTLRLVTNSDTLSKRIESHTEKYRSQFEKAVLLISDISYRLRDHVCIGTAEPIAPVFVLLEEVKQSMSNMIQDAGQVGALICENRMRPCWNLFINYSALLRQESEALANISRETTTTQTGKVRKRSKFTQDQNHDTEEKLVQRRSRLGRCSKFCIMALLVGFVAVAAGLLLNLNCRLSASPHQHCPLDSLAQRISNGFPPM